MAKKTKTKAFSFQGFDATHYKTTAQYVAAVDALFDRATKAIADSASKGTYNPDKPFSFDDYPSVKAHAQKIITGLANNITTVVESGSRKQWLFACQKNDEFVASIMNVSKVSKARLNKMQDRNLDAMQTFQGRKVDGMDLSQRVWKYTEQYKAQIELGLDVGLGEGRSAQQLSRDLRQNLQDPDRLFRRVRDKRGNLQLSKSAKAFHPGIGVYRSSAMNAKRLTRSEINMSYREADWLRWQQLDFVIGFEIKRSNHEPLYKCKLCDRLVGRYPKHFKFKGWHPQCMCHATAILMDESDFDKQELSDLKSALNGSEYKKLEVKNAITDVPDGFKEWVTENQQNQSNWGSTPYFIRDNFNGGLLSKGLSFITQEIPIIVPKPQIVPIVPPEIKEPVSTVSVNMPNELKANSTYLKGENYTFDKKFFDLVDPDNPIPLMLSKANKGAYYSPGQRKVYLFDASRNTKSAWHRKSVVYHEFGHGIDWQRDLRTSQEVADIRAVQITRLRKPSIYKIWTRRYDYVNNKYVNEKVESRMSLVAYIDRKLQALTTKIWGMSDATFAKRGISKMDVLEQVGATRDTIKSLVISYGDGHTTSYFRTPGMQQAEYLAHAFENAFIGNEVFKKYMPDIYSEMVTYIRSLK